MILDLHKDNQGLIKIATVSVEIITQAMIETGVQVEREISDNIDLNLLPPCTQIDSDITLRSETIMSL
jgi:hypothetical protein